MWKIFWAQQVAAPKLKKYIEKQKTISRSYY